MNRKVLTLFMLTLAYFSISTSLAQPRVSVARKPLRIEKVSQIISNPVGWCYWGENWCGWYGGILPDYKNNHITPKWPSSQRLADYCGDPVISMQMKKSKIDTIPVYLLYIGTWSYYYDYPAIKVGRHNFKYTEVFLMSQESYDMLWNLDTGITIIPINTHSNFGELGNYSVGKFGTSDVYTEKEMLTEMNDDKYLTSDRTVCRWHIKKEADGKIRFHPPAAKDIFRTFKPDFNESYYEVTQATFNKLMIK